MMERTKGLSPDAYFGDYVFNESVMKSRLSKTAFKVLKDTIHAGVPLDSRGRRGRLGDEGMGHRKGATHYTHWFQPMTNITAEKHDAFIAPAAGARSSWSFRARS
jgi:glutamine synthetase